MTDAETKPETPPPAERPAIPPHPPAPQEIPPPNFGEQAAAKGATLPDDLAKRIQKITEDN